MSEVCFQLRLSEEKIILRRSRFAYNLYMWNKSKQSNLVSIQRIKMVNYGVCKRCLTHAFALLTHHAEDTPKENDRPVLVVEVRVRIQNLDVINLRSIIHFYHALQKTRDFSTSVLCSPQVTGRLLLGRVQCRR